MTFNKDQNEVKERILTEAKSLFIQNGYNRTSIRDIAKASDTNVAMVNYYFESKYNLFEIIFEEAMEILIQKNYATIESQLPFCELIETWINNYYEILFQHPQIAMFLLHEISQNPDKLKVRMNSEKLLSAFNLIEKRIDEEVQKGTIIKTPAADFLLNILSLSLFPFMFGELAITLMGVSNEKYTELISNHKNYVIEFTKNALRPNTNN